MEVVTKRFLGSTVVAKRGDAAGSGGGVNRPIRVEMLLAPGIRVF